MGTNEELHGSNVDTSNNMDVTLNDLVNKQRSILGKIDEYLSNTNSSSRQLTLKELNYLSTMYSKLSSSISSILFKKKEMEYREQIDFHHPKVQRAFGFLVEAVIESMSDSGMDDTDVNLVMDKLAVKLVGFEDKLNVTLKNISMNAVERTQNPLVSKTLGRPTIDNK